MNSLRYYSHGKFRDGIPEPRKPVNFTKFPAIEKETADWVLAQADDGELVHDCDLKEKALEFAAREKVELKASKGWISRMKKKEGISLRVVTHASQKTEFSEADLFTATIPKGSKTTCTVSLICLADGTKLPAVVVFKATDQKTGVLSEKVMRELKAPWNVIIRSSRKGWWTKELHKEFLDLYFPPSDTRRYLFIDRYPVHKMEEILWQMDERNVERVLIPGGMTGQHQPLDVGVNKPFKDYYRKAFKRWKLVHKGERTKKGNLRTPNRQEVIEFISQAWEKITHTCIQNAFVKSGIVQRND